MSKVIKLGISGNDNDDDDFCIASVIVTMMIMITRNRSERADLRQAVRQINK